MTRTLLTTLALCALLTTTAHADPTHPFFDDIDVELDDADLCHQSMLSVCLMCGESSPRCAETMSLTAHYERALERDELDTDTVSRLRASCRRSLDAMHSGHQSLRQIEEEQGTGAMQIVWSAYRRGDFCQEHGPETSTPDDSH